MAVLDLTELQPNIPSFNFGEYTTFLSAPPKWGKTEWATKYDKPFILDYEEGSMGKVVMRASVETWVDTKRYIRQLIKNPELKLKIQTVVFDTVNYALQACKRYCINQYQQRNPEKKISTFNQIPYGGGWEMLTTEFPVEINKLKRAGYGVVLISHVKSKEFEKETPSAHIKTVPDLTDRERNMISAMADFLLIGEFETAIIEPATLNNEGRILEEAKVETKRVIHLRTGNKTESGFRWKNCPEKIDADFNIFQQVFNEALAAEVEEGVKKYDMDKDTVKKVSEIQKIRKEKAKNTLVEEEKIKNIIEDIKILAKKRKDDGVPVKDIIEVLSIVNGNPDKIKDFEEGQEMIDKLNELSIE